MEQEIEQKEKRPEETSGSELISLVLKDYTVINAKNLHKFIELIKIKMREGWGPQGGIFIRYEDGLCYYQAMILEGEPDGEQVPVEKTEDAPKRSDQDNEHFEEEAG